MRRTFHNADFERLAAFWNDFAPALYRVDAGTLRRNTAGCPVFDWGASVIEEADGEILAFAVVKKSAAALYRGPDQDTAHLTMLAYQDPNHGIDILSDVKQTLRNRGTAKLVFGQDSQHFFPGCPEDFRALADFLMIEGFSKGDEVVDLERDLVDYDHTVDIPPDAEFRLLDEGDQEKLSEFLDREFPGRWRYDVMSKVSLEGCKCVYGLLNGGELEGFALLQDWTTDAPAGGAVWKESLGEKWGSLGPIGVSEKIRGQGYGNALLGSALAFLKQQGVQRCIIDWTNLAGFYEKHGFVPTRRYKPMTLSLSIQ